MSNYAEQMLLFCHSSTFFSLFFPIFIIFLFLFLPTKPRQKTSSEGYKTTVNESLDWALHVFRARRAEKGMFTDLVAFDFVCPLYKFFRRNTGKFVVFALEDCHITAELVLPFECSLVVREGPACRVYGCALQGFDPQRISIGHLHDNDPSELIDLEAVYLLVRGDLPKITVQQTRCFR